MPADVISSIRWIGGSICVQCFVFVGTSAGTGDGIRVFMVTPNVGRPGGCTRPISAFSLMFTRRLSQGAGVYTRTSPSSYEIWITQSTMAVVMLTAHSVRDTRESCNLVTKTLASTPTRALQGMRDGRSGFRKVTNQTVWMMDVVRSTVSFWTRWSM